MDSNYVRDHMFHEWSEAIGRFACISSWGCITVTDGVLADEFIGIHSFC